MMCCVGLFGGLAVGQALGGPWTFVAPAAGFAVGLVGDMKMMKGHQKADAQQAQSELRARADAGAGAPDQGAAAAPTAGSAPGCGIASGAMRMLGMNEKKEKGETTVVESGKTYQADPSEPSARG